MGQGYVATYRGNCQRTGEYEDAGVPDLHGIAWHFQTGGPIDLTPVVADGVVLFGSADGFFYALDGKTGERRWQYPTRGRVTTPADVAEGVVYVCDDAGTLYALDLQTGKAVWLWDNLSWPAYEDMLALAPVEDREWIAFDHVLDNWPPEEMGLNCPTIYGKKLFVMGGDLIIALSLVERTVVWWQASYARTLLYPAVANDILYASGLYDQSDDMLYTLRTETGAHFWSSGASAGPGLVNYEERDWVLNPDSVAVRDNILYVVSYEGIIGVDLSTGEEIWRGERGWLSPNAYGRETALAIGPARVYETIAGLDKAAPMAVSAYGRQSGKVIWRRPSELDTRTLSHSPQLRQPPILAANVLYVLQKGDTCCALDAATGQERWHIHLEPGMLAPVCVADETIFVAAGSAMYALR
ncbi:MAG TPA: PQQ-binding-like beta-propeller repeat protein [Ktedonosporobacter sp.]|nr:PQQ-binding-like beta-propeller repeat protein [Ktedonosporobacter sp.]